MMMASFTGHDCTCSIASARLMLEASGFTVSDASLYGYGGLRQTVEERDEIFTLYCSIVAVLVLIAGLMSGLTLGLMSLDTLDLEVRSDLCSLIFVFFCCVSRAYLSNYRFPHHLQQPSQSSVHNSASSSDAATPSGAKKEWHCTGAEVCKSN